MSNIIQEALYAAQPSASRSVSLHLSYSPKSDELCYVSGNSVFIRSLADTSKSRQYTKHLFPTTVAKFSPSGFYVASADIAGNVKIWDCKGEDMITKSEFQVISGRINDLEWDADSTRIIAVGDGKERAGHCFTFDSGNTVGEISGHTSAVNAVSIRPCRPYRAATVGDDGTLVFYQGPPFKFSQSVKQHTNFIQDVAFSPDGAHLVSVGSDRKIIFYDAKTGDYLSTFEGTHDGSIFGIAWSPNSKLFATCSGDGVVKVWDIKENKLVQEWKESNLIENQILGVVFTSDTQLVAVNLAGTIFVHEIGSSESKSVIIGHQVSITALCVYEKSIFSGSYDGRIMKWSSDGVASEAAKYDSLISGFAGPSSSLFSASWDDRLKEVGSNGGTALKGQPKGIATGFDKIAVVTESNIHVFDSTGKQLKELALKYPAAAVAVGDNLITVGSTQHNKIFSYDFNLDESSVSFAPLRNPPSCFQISPDGKYLAAGDSQGKIVLYSTADGSTVSTRWAFCTSKVTSIEWDSASDLAAVGSLDGNVFVYSALKPSKHKVVKNAHKGGVNAVGWLDSSKIVSGGADATVKIWKLE